MKSNAIRGKRHWLSSKIFSRVSHLTRLSNWPEMSCGHAEGKKQAYALRMPKTVFVLASRCDPNAR